ncbi:16S rRNA (uracil(1498)-N(3))-methyltransferase [Boudabousia marimammalium]|uniref:Ribosomal RNA small subunit methyltransferase E n=1 Tax=Boudabousia marimammalium TaxID=156892 RepID=A0A1Q5PPE9_9ACTO|nr:16S rRNA (uracil(1498)-N(3))-methyltransferase [Boudabousia marimammalium]OKL49320.1 16S rRNA (uracil(1498)-N(3))-methyltransferase [Boudabousia marimammalium]
MTNPVFIADPETSVEQLAEGDSLTVSGGEAKHIQVMRLQAGEALDLVDGQGWRAPAEVKSVDSKTVTVQITGPASRDVTEPALVLVQALAKGGRDESAIAQATEIGVNQVVPWQSDRSIVRWLGPKAEKGVSKWQDAVRAAAKQSRRAQVPAVQSVATTKQLAKLVAEASSRGGQVWLLHEADEARFSSHLRELSQAGEIWILVGPEGGISPAEYEELTQAGAIAVRLGPTVLRSGTAGVVALSVITQQLGLWD